MSLRMVQFNRRQNFLYFHLRDHMAISRRFGVTAKKNEISENESWLLLQRPLKIKKKRASVRSSTAIAEPNGENRVKIRLVDVEIIGLTEILKKKEI